MRASRHRHQPGGGSSGGAGSGAGSKSGGGSPATPAQIEALLHQHCLVAGDCLVGDGGIGLPNPFIIPVTAPAKGGTAGAAPVTVTAADVARFLPADAVLHEEPDGWAVTGVPANFWVDVRAVTVEAPLLGTTADVRFTPQLFRWDYGDGATRISSSAGASWAALGQDQLTATATSHEYGARGRVAADVGVFYSAEYRIDGGAWQAVVGAVEGDAPPDPVLVVHERTVLTNG